MNVSNNCSVTNLELYHHVRLIEFALYTLIFFFGALFNAFALWVFFCKIKKWSETRVYVINLVFVDCFVICTLPCTMPYIAIKQLLKARTFRSPSKAALLCGLLWVSVIIGVTLQLWQRHAALCFQKDTSMSTTLSLLSIFFTFT
ncbi:GPR35 protein, partial [Calonectris borealis]|nr:GPR35 protein [Calonectris borealis]